MLRHPVMITADHKPQKTRPELIIGINDVPLTLVVFLGCRCAKLTPINSPGSRSCNIKENVAN